MDPVLREREGGGRERESKMIKIYCCKANKALHSSVMFAIIQVSAILKYIKPHPQVVAMATVVAKPTRGSPHLKHCPFLF